jgi:hypothetical protein
MLRYRKNKLDKYVVERNEFVFCCCWFAYRFDGDIGRYAN